MNVLFATVEMSPLAKVGGLADVAGSLPKALVALGHDVRVLMPKHGVVDTARYAIEPTGETVRTAPLVGPGYDVAVWRALVHGVHVFLLDIPALFDRPRVYGETDDNLRWLAFCDAVLAWLRTSAWRPEVLHLNEWHSAFVASRLRLQPASSLARVPRLYTIHNLAIHGAFDERFAKEAGFDERVLASALAGEPWMTRTAMGQGILWSDLVNTVSPTYAREILEAEYGAGLDPLLLARRQHLYGILNGIDYEEFNPGTDPCLPARYTIEHFGGHATNRAALRQCSGLIDEPNVPIAGMVTRLFHQKGVDLAAEAIEMVLARRPIQFVVLGMGEARYQDQLLALAARHPGRVAVTLAFDGDLAQQIYGGSDLFLMPSRFEPCGLGQMIALRYGSVPVVRNTGGLADTVREWTDPGGQGNGFVFQKPAVAELVAALERALDLFQAPAQWQLLVERGMTEDLSWQAAARQYVQLYENARTVAVSGASPTRLP